jgi:hypothetical protein
LWPVYYYILMVLISLANLVVSVLAYRTLIKYMRSIDKSAKKATDPLPKHDPETPP